ncbi:MAG TPA: DUF2950 family protein [Planctomycetota bacterium]|nr:DUF2950 family protein [Planctomycetota bacterium]
MTTETPSPLQNPADRLRSEVVGEWRRFRRIFLVFAALGAVMIGVPLAMGIVRYRREAAEARIVEQLRAYNKVQGAWHSKARAGSSKLRYCDDLAKLVDLAEAPEEARKLVDAAFAAARGSDGTPKDGYRYREMRTIFGAPINWDGDFAICATPAVYGETGRKTYLHKTDGDVWEKDLGKSEFLTDFPTNIEGAGWKKSGDRKP